MYREKWYVVPSWAKNLAVSYHKNWVTAFSRKPPKPKAVKKESAITSDMWFLNGSCFEVAQKCVGFADDVRGWRDSLALISDLPCEGNIENEVLDEWCEPNHDQITNAYNTSKLYGKPEWCVDCKKFPERLKRPPSYIKWGVDSESDGQWYGKLVDVDQKIPLVELRKFFSDVEVVVLVGLFHFVEGKYVKGVTDMEKGKHYRISMEGTLEFNKSDLDNFMREVEIVINEAESYCMQYRWNREKEDEK